MKQRFSIGAQLGMIMGLALLLLGTVIGFTLFELTRSGAAYQQILSGTVPRTLGLQRSQDDFHRGLSELRGYMAYGDEKYAADTMTILTKSQEEVQKFVAETNAAESKQIGENLLAEYPAQLADIQKGLALKRTNDPGLNSIMMIVRDRSDTMNGLFDKLVSIQNSRMQDMGRVLNEQQAAAVRLAAGVSLTVLLFVIVLLVWYSRRLMRRLTVLNNELLAVSKLDLSKPDVCATQNDEIGDMASAVIHVKHELINIIRQLHGKADALSAASEELSAAVGEQLQASENIANTITAVAAGADQNTTNIGEISAVTQQVGAGAEEISASASHVNSTTQDAVGDAAKGMQLIHRLVDQNATIESSMGDITRVSEALVKRSDDIQQIVTTISTIAGQTNLLALNAAIEAARAGEAGRGFAVVAEEVRKLAEQSAVATSEIEGIIGQMTDDIQFTVEVVGKANAEVKAGKTATDETQQGFQAITEKLEQVKDGMDQISHAVEETAQGMQTVVDNIQNISAVAQETSASAQTVAASAEEQNASLHGVSNNSDALAQMATELNALAAQFKL